MVPHNVYTIITGTFLSCFPVFQENRSSKLNIHKGHIKQHLNGVQLTMQILTCITILFHNHQTMTSVTTKIHCAPIVMIHVAPDIKCHTYIF